MILVEADASEEWDSRGDWPALAERAAKAAVAASDLAWLGASTCDFEVSVRFSSDEDVRTLNAAWRAKDKATNVLSFPMIERDLLVTFRRSGPGEALLGDVILAHGVCAREAAEKGVAVETHAAHLIVHGMLHLLGYDHETGDEDADAMEETERRALATIGISDPYQVTEVQT
ncbi:MAG TPA: rRNA maturation RNase YbeY [Allosphingosinicella sp.]|jgi:probable rRNA maturation factor|nr:rRNA maturation RNase YbeY [Allosphingosinicella sp.]